MKLLVYIGDANLQEWSYYAQITSSEHRLTRPFMMVRVCDLYRRLLSLYPGTLECQLREL